LRGPATSSDDRFSLINYLSASGKSKITCPAGILSGYSSKLFAIRTMPSRMTGMLKFKSKPNFKPGVCSRFFLPAGLSCFALPASQRQGKKNFSLRSLRLCGEICFYLMRLILI
jgi:hypothetical protein